MIREVMKYQPDLAVLATGHKRIPEDRTYRQIKQRGWIRRRLPIPSALSVSDELSSRETKRHRKMSPLNSRRGSMLATAMRRTA